MMVKIFCKSISDDGISLSQDFLGPFYEQNTHDLLGQLKG